MTDYADREPFELVQPIILLVDREEPAPAGHGIAAVALASVQAFMRDPENPAWPVWAAGAFAKSVRRADAKMFAKVLAAHPEHVLSQVGEASAAGLPPMPAQELPKLLAKLQVSGTQLPAGGQLPEAPVRIMLNASLEMSTGKSAAQAAHALFAWLIEAGQDEVEAWADAGFPVSVHELDGAGFAAGLSAASGPVIQDAGRTEIEPGSTTAYVVSALSGR